MKYLLSVLFIILSFSSYANEFEDMCLKIGYKSGSSKFDACVKKLEARKKPLNKVNKSKLVKKTKFDAVQFSKTVGTVVAIGVAADAVAQGLASGEVSNPLKNSSVNNGSKVYKYRKTVPSAPDTLGGNVNSQAMEYLNLQKLGILP